AFVNGAAANVHDFDDTHLPTVIHPAAPVVPAVLAGVCFVHGAAGLAQYSDAAVTEPAVRAVGGKVHERNTPGPRQPKRAISRGARLRAAI
ncbi:MAG: MmgE/PrpD family protein, partial [Betaproteobacteria bacterium]